MKKILKKITDLTINDILQQEIILPSVYLKTFNDHAKDLEINIQDEKFEKEINKVILDELENIDNYMKNIEQNMKMMKKITKDNKKALLENKTGSFDSILKDIHKLEKNMQDLNDKLYKDELIKTYNRKWIYNQFLEEEAKFRKKGICALIDISDFDYITREYGKLIATNYVIFIIDFIKKRFDKLGINYEIAKYLDDKFLIFIEHKSIKDIDLILFNLKKAILATTLKSKSGLLINGNLDYYYEAYNERQDSQELFENLFAKKITKK